MTPEINNKKDEAIMFFNMTFNFRNQNFNPKLLLILFLLNFGQSELGHGFIIKNNSMEGLNLL
ncbi:MAG: hypothetical protein Kow0019_09090 [Methanobacteriaceae archaeon]